MTKQKKNKNIAIPLCVDLDGTLIKTDMLYEAVFKLLRMNLFYIFMLPIWWLKGKAYLKDQIAQLVIPDVTTLPYRENLLSWLQEQKADGRKLILATASNERYGNAVAEHLGVFDDVYASTTTVNLSGSAKTKKLVDEFGDKGFDYIGNSRADIPVWDHSREAITIGYEKIASTYAQKEHAHAFSPQEPQKSPIKTWAKALRVHQWLKNTLLFVPAILAFGFITTDTVAQLLIAFFSFSFCASSVYLLNDLTDLEMDRRHKSKYKRPIPSGDISAVSAAVVSMGLLVLAFAMSFLLPFNFTLALGAYYIATCAYSFALKRMLLIDVLTLSGLFTIRVFAGAMAIHGNVSTWLLAFSMFFFLNLAFVKRFVEVSAQLEGATRAQTGRGYQSIDLESLAQFGISSGFASVVVLALFIDTPQMIKNYSNPNALWLVCPLVLYLIARIWVLARRGEMHDDPVVFLMTDWRSQAMIAAGAVLMLFAQIV